MLHSRKLHNIAFFLLFSIVDACAGSTAASAMEKDSLMRVQDSIAELFRIDEVTVVARQEKDVMPPQLLKGEQMKALSTTSVADAVRYFSGVQIKDYGGVGGMKTVDVRSMGSHHLGVFYDGIEIGNAQNGTVDLGKFSMDNLEEIALYNGQKSEIFQPAKDFGSAGTLYLKTRRPKFERVENGSEAYIKPYNVEIRMKAGAFGLANPSLLYEQRITENIHLSLNAEYTFATGRYHYHYEKRLADGSIAWDTTAVRENGDVQAFRAEAGLFGYSQSGKWHLKGYYYQSGRGIPGAIVNNVWKNAQRQWDRNAFVQGNYTTEITDKLSLQANIKYSNDYLRYLNPDTTLMYVDNQFLQQELYASVAGRYRIFPFWDVALAADYQLNWLDGNMQQFVHPLRHTLLVSAATAVSYRWLKLQASVLETFVSDTLRACATSYSDKRAATYNAVTPAVFFNAKPILSEEWYVRAFYKMVYRMPTFSDLYYTDIGSSNLKPEKTRQYDIGTEYSHLFSRRNSRIGSLEGIQLGAKADVYFNQVENKIVAIPKGNSQYRWMMMNLGYVEIFGAEFAADLSLIFPREHTFIFHGGYTWQQALDRTDPQDNDPYGGTYGGQIAYIPRHSFSLTATYQWQERLYLAYALCYVGKRYTSSANIPVNQVQPWYTSDVSFSYAWLIPSPRKGEKIRLQAGIEANNIFNQQYEVIPNYPMPGFNGKGILKLSL